MKIAAISDLHGVLPSVPECDILVIAGDICPAYDHALSTQSRWLDTIFREWIDNVPASHVVAIAGNHDWIFQKSPQLVPKLGWSYLEDSEIIINGVKFYGTPWTPWFFGWAFNAERDDSEGDLREKFASIPHNTDVLISHGPPLGYVDVVGGRNAGSAALLATIDVVKPKAVICGHIHESYGSSFTNSGVNIYNVSILDGNYRLTHQPTILEI